eukprot:s1252_g11.t1
MHCLAQNHGVWVAVVAITHQLTRARGKKLKKEFERSFEPFFNSEASTADVICVSSRSFRVEKGLKAMGPFYLRPLPRRHRTASSFCSVEDEGLLHDVEELTGLRGRNSDLASRALRPRGLDGLEGVSLLREAFEIWRPKPKGFLQMLQDSGSGPVIGCATASQWATPDLISSRSQWAMPDLNRKSQIPVTTAGPQPRAPDPSGHCRTSTASSRSQWALPDLNAR